MPTNVSDRELRGADFKVGISPQTEKDVIDTDPVFSPMRRTEGKTNKTVNYTNDPSVQIIGQAQEQIQDTQDLGMELSSVVSKQSIEMLIQAIHAETITNLVSSTATAATASGFTSDTDEFGPLQEGDGIWVSGFSDADINRFYIITGKTSDGEIATYPAPAATAAMGDSVEIRSNRSLNEDKPTYNALQTRATDLSQVDDINYHTIFNGIINTFSMEVGETGLLSSTMNFVAEDEVTEADGSVSTRPVSGQSYLTPATDRAVTARKNAQAAVKAFYVDDESATCSVKSITIEIDNQYQKDEAAGCEAYYTRGQFAISGSAVVRSKISNPFVWRNRSWNAIRAKIGFRLSHGNGEETYIVVNRNTVTEHTQPDGNNVAANSEISFVGELEPVKGHTVEVYRNWGHVV